MTLESPLYEILLRTAIVYIVLAVIVRVMPKRVAGSLSPNDLIALVIVGGLTADAIAVGAESTPDLLLMVAVVFILDFAVNWLEYRFPRFRRVAQDSPTLIIHNGQVVRRNLGRELMTEEELSANLRLHGTEDIGEVKQAILEVDGHLSIVKNEPAQ